MNAGLLGIGGAAGLAVVCFILFIEEAGLPLPAPGEVVLLVAGVAVAQGASPLWVVLPATCAATCLGAFTGYTWSCRVGTSRVLALATRVGAGRACERLITRVAGARPAWIAAARLTPGLRIYTTLACGAARVDRTAYLAGALPSAILWVTAWIAVGVLAGVPAVRIVGDSQRLEHRIALLALVVLAAAALIGVARRFWSHRGAR